MNGSTASGPLARYQTLVAAGRLQADAAQHGLAKSLQSIHQALVGNRRGLIDRLRQRHPPVTGAWIHGQVGRGKTLLMDLFAESLGVAGVPTRRVHFHRFMDEIHQRMRGLRQERNPLQLLGREIAGQTRVLCFDECHVADIGDAMILGGLFDALFSRGVTLVATSNSAPAELYAGGLQRDRFLPAIALIERHCTVLCLDSREDYRLRELIRHPTYHHPDDDQARLELEEEFRALAAGEQISDADLVIRGRTIKPLKRAGSVVWFDFETLCQGPRASGDYIELARRFGTIMVSGIPRMDEADNNAARRFIHLVDECYDRAVKLIVSAAVEPESLYTGTRLASPFQRTVSRLIEMQSRNYLALAHKP